MGLIKGLLDFIYPPLEECYVCGKEILWSEVTSICQDCLEQVEFCQDYCQICGRELGCEKRGINDLCEDCSKEIPPFKQARSSTIYNGIIRDLLLQFKYGGRRELVKPLGILLNLYYFEYYKNNKIDIIIPIPLHEERLGERGYNQSLLLAQVLQKEVKLPLYPDLLVRAHSTPPLYDLGVAKRRSLIKGAFSLHHRKEILANRNVLLVDDIFTTGTTVSEASLLLKEEGGAGEIYVMTLATARLAKKS